MTEPKSGKRTFLFQLDVMVSAKTNGEALAQLLQAMNKGGFEDYRVTSGVELGQAIEQALAATPEPRSVPIEVEPPASDSPLEERIRRYMEEKKLIRLNVNKGRGVKLNMPCRIIGFDGDKGLLSVYHVDEKQVYNISLNEIDDFLE